MQFKKITVKKDSLLLAYKLLYDLLLLLLLTFTGTLIAEGLLPGLVSSKISFSKLTLSLILTLALIVWLGKKLDITYSQIKINKSKILPLLVMLSFLLIGNSLLKFSFWENIIITLSTLFAFFLFFELFYSSEDQ